MAETDKVRNYLLPFCEGKGVDIACGDNKITPSAIGVDFAQQYNLSDHPVTKADFIGSWEDFFSTREYKEFDYIYSSHLIEDYTDPFTPLLLWGKYLKHGGYLILVLPIEETYRRITNNYNAHHKNNWKGPADFLTTCPDELFNTYTYIKGESVVDYNFYVVFKKK